MKENRIVVLNTLVKDEGNTISCEQGCSAEVTSFTLINKDGGHG